MANVLSVCVLADSFRAGKWESVQARQGNMPMSAARMPDYQLVLMYRFSI